MGTRKIVNVMMESQGRTLRYLMGYDDSDASWQGNGTTKPSTLGGSKGRKSGTGQATVDIGRYSGRHWRKGSPPRLSVGKRLKRQLFKGISTVYVESLTLWHGRKTRLSLFAVVNRLIRSLVGLKPMTSTMHGTTNLMNPSGSSTTLEPWPTVPTLAWAWRDGAWHPPSCPTQCVACRGPHYVRRNTIAPTGRDVVPCDPSTGLRKDTT